LNIFIASSSRKILNCGRGEGNFFEKKQNKSCCFQNVFNFPVACWLRGFFDFSDSFQFVFRLSIFFVTSTQRASSFGLRLFFFALAFKLLIALPKAER